MRKLTLFCLLLFTSPAWSADKLTVLLDWFVNPDHGPIVVAQELGYFEHEGLDVTIVPPADPSAPPKLVAAGKADLAVSYQPQLHLQVHEGLPLVRVGTLVATPLNCLLTLADGPVDSLADLKGRKIGFSVAGIEEAILGFMLAQHGMTLDDVELINVNFSLSPALLSGQVDAVIGAFRNFELNQLQIEGHEGRCYYIEEEGVPPYDELIYVTRPDHPAPGAIARFLRATERATQFIVNRPEQSWEIFSATSRELDDELNRRAWSDTLTRFALRPAGTDLARYARFESWLAAEGLIDHALDAQTLSIEIQP